MKRCPKCKEVKNETDFARNSSKKDGLNSNCKACQKITKDKHYINNKTSYKEKSKQQKHKIIKQIMEVKQSLACIKCGNNHPAVLDFHHRNPKEKEVNISQALSRFGWGLERVLKEIEKCDVLCSNCHRILHYEENIARYASGEAA